MEPETISISKFKTHCLKLIDRMGKTHRPLIITKRGKPVAQVLLPQVTQSVGGADSPFGSLEGTVTIRGDVIGPFHEEWGQWSND